jgi:hypothetical protein
MNSSSTRLPAPEGPGSVARAPYLPAGSTDAGAGHDARPHAAAVP